MKRMRWLVPALLVMSLVGCVSTYEQDPANQTPDSNTKLTDLPFDLYAKPVFINHQRPTLKIDNSLIRQTDCTPRGAVDPTWYSCEEGTPLREMGCDFLDSLPNEFAGLKGDFQMVALCAHLDEDGWQDPSDINIFSKGCLIPYDYWLLVLRDGRYDLLKSGDDIRIAFAPVDSSEEALGYAILGTGYAPLYGLSHNPNLRYHTPSLEDTHVIDLGDSYAVNLYDSQSCGCRNFHPAKSVIIIVEKDDKLRPTNPHDVYSDPSYDGACID